MSGAASDTGSQDGDVFDASPCHRQQSAFGRVDADSSTPVKAERVRILIVEDDFLVAADIEAALISADYEVVGIATTASEAITLAKSGRPAMAIMDIRLTGKKDGIDTALELFNEQGLRCIFATAHSDDEARRRAVPAKPLGWIQKPYSIASLLSLIEQVLKLSG